MIADYHDTQRVAERLKQATGKLHKLALEVGVARQVREFNSDMRKNLLARYMLGPLKEGQSAAAAETYARANPQYQKEFEQLQIQSESAEQTISLWQAEQASFEAARSLLSFEKATMDRLDG